MAGSSMVPQRHGSDHIRFLSIAREEENDEKGALKETIDNQWL
jgi:hypothetical protein